MMCLQWIWNRKSLLWKWFKNYRVDRTRDQQELKYKPDVELREFRTDINQALWAEIYQKRIHNNAEQGLENNLGWDKHVTSMIGNKNCL